MRTASVSLMVLVLQAACSGEQDSPAGPAMPSKQFPHYASTLSKYEETVLATLRDNWRVKYESTPPASSEAKFAIVVVDEDSHKEIVITDTGIGDAFDLVDAPVWSPDGRHISYTAQDETKRVVVIDSKRFEVGYPLVSTPSWCPSSSRVAVGVAGTRRDLWEAYVVFPEGKKRMLEGLEGGQPRFSPEGELAFTCHDKSYRYKLCVGDDTFDVPKDFVVRGDLKFAESGHDSLINVMYHGGHSLAGQRVVLRGLSEVTPGRERIDGFGFVRETGLWYVWRQGGRGGGYLLSVGEKSYGPFERILGPWFDADSNRYVFATRSDFDKGRSKVVIDGSTYAVTGTVQEATACRNGDQVAVISVTDGGYEIYVNQALICGGLSWAAGIHIQERPPGMSYMARVGQRVVRRVHGGK